MKTKFKGADALLLESSALKAVFTVRGSKMVSLLDKVSGKELLLQSNNDILAQGCYDSDYNAADVCGFDEMYPNIDACYYERSPWHGTKLPDHGEVWGLDWDCSQKGGCIEAQVRGVRLPYILQKKIYFKNAETLRIDYTLENLSPFDMDNAWAAHAMFALEDGSKLVLPESSGSGIVTYSHDGRVGRYGDVVPLNTIDAVLPEATYMDKVYLNAPVSNGRCGATFPSVGRTCLMAFPADSVPYLGVLVSNGLHLGNCAILEPCTGALDRPDRARAFGMNNVLRAKGAQSWYLEFSVVDSR